MEQNQIKFEVDRADFTENYPLYQLFWISK